MPDLQLAGGFMIMMLLLGLLLAAVWLSLPFLLFALRRRIDESHTTMLRLEGRIARLEQQIKGARYTGCSQAGQETADGGTDGTA